MVQVEPGFPAKAVETLASRVKINEWAAKGVYFGGVHAVIPGIEGVADARRGGGVIEIE